MFIYFPEIFHKNHYIIRVSIGTGAATEYSFDIMYCVIHLYRYIKVYCFHVLFEAEERGGKLVIEKYGLK